MDGPLVPSTPAEGAGPETEGDAKPEATGAAKPQPQAIEPAKPDATPEPTQAQKSGLQLEERDGAWYSPDGKRFRPDDDFAKVQSQLDRQIAQERQLRQQAEAKASENAYRAQVEALYLQFRNGYVEQGFDEKTANAIAERETRATVLAFEKDQENIRLQKRMQEIEQANNRTAQSTLARDMAQKYGVPSEDIPTLLTASTPEGMEKLASRLGTMAKQLKEQAKARQAEVPAGGPEQKFDTGGGISGPSDDQLLADMNTPLDVVERILEKRGIHPFR